MRSVWFRLSRWGVAALGAALAFSGLGAMWDGWDKIQIERGWSLFIAGSVATAGGVVTLALAAVLARLDHAILAAAAPAQTPQPAKAREVSAAPPRAPVVAPFDAFPKKAVEVDRFVEGDMTYVMFSDGAVEVRGSSGAKRFSSLSELRAAVGDRG